MNKLTIEKPWGRFEQFTHNENTTVKIISINAMEALSLQSHHKRSEFWKIIKGDGVVEIDNVKYNIKEGEEYTIPIGAEHRATAGSYDLVFLEIAFGDFDEEDITRIQDKYGRA